MLDNKDEGRRRRRRERKIFYYYIYYISNEEADQSVMMPVSFCPMVKPHWKCNDIKPLRDRSNL